MRFVSTRKARNF
eukprot:CCRYP_000241-RB/>CCRYP_000241-RB protein AED:0.45 eAED:1.00 QI:0/-1/0/1/-1/0/1/0/12